MQRGEWGINPGQPAPVSTSPLWTFLMVPGQVLQLPLLWAFLLGALCWTWTAWETFTLARALFPEDAALPTLSAAVVLFEWHLAWAAFSGMETLLFAAISLAAIRTAIVNVAQSPSPAIPGLVPRLGARRAAFTGFLTGLLTATRPEGLLLAALLTLRTRSLILVAAVAAVLLPVALLNLFVGGNPLPATFYAKNAAYAPGANALVFLGAAAVELARGPLFTLYPGLVVALARLTTSSPHRLVATWVLGLLAAYALWLPVLYHHGRYLIPLIPLLVLYGLAGTRMLLQRLPFRMLPRAVAATLILVVAVSWLRGAQVYGENVAYIGARQVVLARWFSAATPQDAVVATHDIGAFGYFSGRRLVDVAGLATPELVTSPKEVDRVLDVLSKHDASYVAVLVDWYPPLTEALLKDRAYRLRPDPPGDGFIVLERVR